MSRTIQQEPKGCKCNCFQKPHAPDCYIFHCSHVPQSSQNKCRFKLSFEEVVNMIERMKYLQRKVRENVDEMTSVSPTRPNEALSQWIYNQALQDVIREIKNMIVNEKEN